MGLSIGAKDTTGVDFGIEIPGGDLDLLAIGETLVDLTSVKETDTRAKIVDAPAGGHSQEETKP